MPSRLAPLAKLARNPDLRRCGVGFALFNAAEYGEWIALLVYAFAHGGASTSGLLAFAQLIPCALLTPFLATAVDRYQPGKVLAAGFLAQGIGMALLALALLAHAPAPLVYALAIVVAPSFNLTRPTMNVLLPPAVHTPDELTAGNAAMGWIESSGVVAGPLLTALLLLVGGPGSVLAVFAALMLVSAWVALPLTRSLPAPEQAESGSPIADAIDGFRLLAGDRGTTLLVAVLTSQSLLLGAIDVLVVVLSIDVLGLGNAGVGVLNAAFGVGGLVAVVLTLGLVGRRRLAPAIVEAAILMAAVALIAVWPHIVVALALLAVTSVGRSLFDVSGRTLLQRTGSPAVLGRIFGVLESIDMLGLALGSILVPALIHFGGTKAAIVGVGGIMPLVTLLLLPAILGADARATVPIVQIGLLRASPIFQPLRPPELEAVARQMQPLAVAAGSVVVREGDPGDLYYLIGSGALHVTAHGLDVDLGRGDGFGEIALLHDVPRTATVTARGDAGLFTLTRDDFLTAVMGHADIDRRVRGLARERLEGQTP
ncbi:MAG TPA: MFS transporter [Gaiellales bacterium]